MQTRSFENKEGMKHISLRLDKDLHKKLRLYAFEHEKSLSLVMEESIREKIEKEGVTK